MSASSTNSEAFDRDAGIKPRSSLNWKMQLAFGSALVFLLIIGAFSYRGMAVSSESGQWLRHTHEVLENFQDLLLAMQSIESNYRGFVLTGNDSYLKTYRAGIVRLEQDQTRLRSLTADDPQKLRRFPELARLVARKIERGERVIALRRTRGVEAAADAMRSGPGQQLMDEFEALVRRMQDDERQLLVLRHADVEKHLAQTKLVLIFGTVLGLLITAVAAWSVRRDSFRRAFVEQALRDSDEKYRMLLDGVQDYAIFMLDPEGRILSWNAGAERITGYKAEEIVGRSISCFYSPQDNERGKAEEVLRLTTARGRHEEQGMRMRKDGSRFLTSATLTALRDRAGNLRGFSVIGRDLSESAESEARYRGLLEAAPDAMVVVNPAGEIVLLNVQAEKQFGYHRDELLGQPVKNIIPRGFAERLVADGLRSAEDALAQQIGTGIELSGRRKNGSDFPIEIMLSPSPSAEGILVTAAIRDIGRRKDAQADLLQKVAELNRSNEELEQFAYVASHDLQEPLRMVASYMQLLSRRYHGKLDADADEFIAFAVDGASRMQRLIKDLLAYSRVASKGKDLLETSSEDALQEALLNLRGAVKESGALVTHDVLPRVLADDMQLTQLFQNLVGNAIKYQRPGVPRIHIAATRDGGQKWIFSVQDNGLGIDAQYFEKIFGLFQRLHKREEFAGTGIGLAICRKIVERHGGSISVESKPGQGSIFRFVLTGSARAS